MIRKLLAAALLAVGLISASAVLAADIVDASGSTPLLVAASNDDVAQVKQLLKAGANPNVRNKLDATPLLAMRTGRASSLEDLLAGLIFMGDDRAVERTFIAGRAVSTRQ